MRAVGATDEEIAREMVDMRDQAKEITRAGMTPEEVPVPEARNIAKYGSWQAVTDVFMRTGYAVDRELGLECRPCPPYRRRCERVTGVRRLRSPVSAGVRRRRPPRSPNP